VALIAAPPARLEEQLLGVGRAGRLRLDRARDAHQSLHELGVGRRRLAAAHQRTVLHAGAGVAAQREAGRLLRLDPFVA
jgi:hypothetical protein